jgi:hypothetical protein
LIFLAFHLFLIVIGVLSNIWVFFY